MRALKLALFASAALLPAAAFAQPIQGLYVGGAGGANWLESERTLSSQHFGVTTPNIPAVQASYKAGATGELSLGYALGDGWRFEIEGLYSKNDRDLGGAPPAGTSYNGSERKLGVLANALFDIDIGSPYIYPFIGAGAGYVDVTRHVRTIGTPNSYFLNSSGGSMAEQAIAGASFPVPGVVGLSVTAEYRFLVVNGTHTFTGTQVNTTLGSSPYNFRSRDDHNHSILLGLRYAFDVTPPPMPAPAPAPVVAAPAPAPARSYLVFFDWDKADLTARAQQIIAEAASNVAKVGSTRIAVAGHADKSGTPQYNMGLSLRRANTVAAELVRLGVAKTEIAITAYGDTKPLVPTAPGVREPQNRRVEIVLN
jgi:OmpA-OmpF porin, OOP family